MNLFLAAMEMSLFTFCSPILVDDGWEKVNVIFEIPTIESLLYI